MLDEDHYGLKELKERILEFIAVGNLTGGVSGKIILLVGPPGVGKTRLEREESLLQRATSSHPAASGSLWPAPWIENFSVSAWEA